MRSRDERRILARCGHDRRVLRSQYGSAGSEPALGSVPSGLGHSHDGKAVAAARTFNGPSGVRADVDNAMLSSGAVDLRRIGAAHAVLSRDVVVNESAVVEDSVLFDGVVVGEGARLRNCIVDKGVRIPPGETIGYDMPKDRQRFTVSEAGIVVVPKSYCFPPTTTDEGRDKASHASPQRARMCRHRLADGGRPHRPRVSRH